MSPLILAASASMLLAVTFLVMAVGGRRASSKLAERLNAFRLDGQGSPTPAAEAPRFRTRSYSGLPLFSSFLSQFKGSEAVAVHLERAGVPLRVGEFYLIRYGMAGLFFVLPLLFGLSPMSLTVALSLAVLGYLLPAMWVGSKRRSRTARINAQLVEMLGLVSNALKSGYGLLQSFEFASRQMAPPLALELRRMLREANLGLGAEEALNALGERIDSADLGMVLTAINIQRTAGGNLAEILDNVAFTMRERERIRGEVTTLTSQQKMTGVIIGGLPIGMGVLFMIINPDYMGLLFTELAGQVMLGLAVALEGMGILVMKRILAIEV